jgi:hypothetical protein
MENLTTKQQEIIQSIKEQFSLINSSRPKKSDNPLLNYANEFNEAKQLELEERALIEAKNNAIVFNRKDAIEKDAYYLNDLLFEAGLEDVVDLEINRDSIVLSGKNYDIWIMYEIIYKNNHSFSYANSIAEYDSFIVKYGTYKRHSIQEIINLETFKTSFKNMLNHLK